MDTQKSDSLRSCPFCGSDARQEGGKDEPLFRCSNSHCNNRRFDFFTWQEWNTRPIEDKLSKQLEIAVEALEHYAGLTGAPNKASVAIAVSERIGKEAA